MADLTTDQVWAEIEKNLFAVLGMVTAKNEARTTGIVYIVHERKLYIGTLKNAFAALIPERFTDGPAIWVH